MPRRLPNLPAGWEFVNEDAPPEADPVLSSGQSSKQAGSVLRTIMGPQKPEYEPTLGKDFVKPVAERAFKTLVPTTPEGIGMFLASTMLAGPGGPVARALGTFAPEAVPALEALGATGVRRVLGMGAAGAGIAGMTGSDPMGGAASGILTQLGGEAVSKLTRWASMNAQAKQLAQEDPKKLGEVVSTIIPDLRDIKTANDFHAAFNSGGAQQTISQAYARDMGEVSAKAAGTPIRSALLDEMKGAGYTGTPGTLQVGQGGVTSKEFTFDEAADTLKRLRTQGWNQDEIARGLGARDARQAAEQLGNEIKAQLPPDVADKFVQTDAMYARGRKLIDYLSDKDLLDAKGDLNIPKLQKKFKAEGYNPRQSLQMAADALALKESIFRGSDMMAEDVAGEPGRFFDHVRVHFGIVPTMYPKLPKLGSYAGMDPMGLTPYGGTQVSELLKRGIQNRKPISLSGNEEN